MTNLHNTDKVILTSYINTSWGLPSPNIDAETTGLPICSIGALLGNKFKDGLVLVGAAASATAAVKIFIAPSASLGLKWSLDLNVFQLGDIHANY